MMKANVRSGLLGLLFLTLALAAGAQTIISNNELVTGLTSGSPGLENVFQIYLPSTQTLQVRVVDGTGTVSVYLRRGAVPTTSVYDRASLSSGSHLLTVSDAATGWWYIMIYANTAYSGKTLRGRFWTELAAGQTPVISGAHLSYTFFRLEVPTGRQVLHVETMDGTGDADLYIKRGDFPTPESNDGASEGGTNNEMIQVENPTAGQWYIAVRGYQAFANTVLIAASAFAGGGPAPMIESALYGGAAGDWVYAVVDADGVSADYIYMQSWHGTGNADLYVRQGKPPMTYMNRYHSRSTGTTNAEELRVEPAATGRWWVGLRATTAFFQCKLLTQVGSHAGTQPTLTPGPGTYNSPQQVVVSGGGHFNRYTTDGSNPNPDSPHYMSTPIAISSTTTLKVKAYSDHSYRVPSTTRTALYTITGTGTAPIHRFWSPVYGAHFFTISEAEKNMVINNWPDIWTYEGIAWHAFAAAAAGTSPIYRFWSPVYGAHFFTISEAEKNMIINNWPDIWTYEGIAWHAHPAQAAGTSPIYRFWSPVYGAHFYTISEAEKNMIINNWPHLWTYEGMAYYAYAAPASGSVIGPAIDGSAAAEAAAEPGPAAPEFDALAAIAGTPATAQSAEGDAISGGVFFPLTYDDTYVTAAVYDPAAAAWDQVLPVTWAPAGVACANLRLGQPYWLAVLAHEAETATWVLEHGSWFGRLAAPAEDVAILAEAPAALGRPIETIRLPEADGPLTLQLYCPIEERDIETATGLASGSEYDLLIPAWNRQYRLDVFDAHGQKVLSTWLGHLRTH